MLESATWRSSRDRGEKIGYSQADPDVLNRKPIDLLSELYDKFEPADSPMVVSGCVGPRGKGFDPGAVMTPQGSQAHHARQIGVFAETLAYQITAITMTNADEAAAVAQADDATGGAPVCCMINCARPDHFADTLKDDGWARRIRGIRANAFRCSHAELDEAEGPDDGDPVELGTRYAALRGRTA